MYKNKPLSPEEQAKIREYCAQGVPIHVMSNELHRARKTLRQYIIDNNIARVIPKRNTWKNTISTFSKEELCAINDMRRERKTWDQIGKSFYMSRNTVTARLKKQGINPQDVGVGDLRLEGDK